MAIVIRRSKCFVYYGRTEDIESGIEPTIDAVFDTMEQAQDYVTAWNSLYDTERYWYACTE